MQLSFLHFSQKRELFLFPITTLLPSLIVRSLFAHCSFFVRSLFVLCSFFVRSLFVLCSFFVRLFFVFSSSFLRLLFICPCGSHLSVWLAPACAARTAYRATTSHRFPFKACPPSGVRGLSSHRHLSLAFNLVFLALLALLVLN